MLKLCFGNNVLHGRKHVFLNLAAKLQKKNELTKSLTHFFQLLLTSLTSLTSQISLFTVLVALRRSDNPLDMWCPM